jgi:hypothetical protein
VIVIDGSVHGIGNVRWSEAAGDCSDVVRPAIGQSPGAFAAAAERYAAFVGLPLELKPADRAHVAEILRVGCAGSSDSVASTVCG